MPTYELLSELAENFPDSSFIFCLGTDIVKGVRSWDNGEKLFNETNFIILNRPCYEIDVTNYPPNYRQLNVNFTGSSTEIRNRIAKHLENKNKLYLGINALTTTSVIKYILDNQLYQTKL